jgi:hypothetical protein
MKIQKLILCLLTTAPLVSAFSTPSPQASFLDSIASIFQNNSGNNNKINLGQKRSQLKNDLLELCSSGKPNEIDRKEVEIIMEELAQIRPFDNTASSPSLQKEWILKWTTEKEINIFSEWNISGEVTQTIQNGDELISIIPFKKGGGLTVEGLLSVDESDDDDGDSSSSSGIRTNFEFSSATLDLNFVKLTLPPIGKGWFDTIYLDEELRVDVNSRNDILIVVPR